MSPRFAKKGIQGQGITSSKQLLACGCLPVRLLQEKMGWLNLVAVMNANGNSKAIKPTQ